MGEVQCPLMAVKGYELTSSQEKPGERCHGEGGLLAYRRVRHRQHPAACPFPNRRDEDWRKSDLHQNRKELGSYDWLYNARPAQS